MIAKLLPNRVRRTYLGGGRIDAFTGGSRLSRLSTGETPVVPVEMSMPEDWMASTTTAFNGTLEIEGEGLGRLEDGRLVKDVVGTLPILVKLLDSDERLVIQAHPTVPCAKRLFNSPVGKTECWYFLPGTAPDACVYLGFKPGITRAAWEEAFWGGLRSCAAETDGGGSRSCATEKTDAQERVPPELLSFLHCIPVKAGDFVFVDGGMPHAIGGGCFMIELQEPSDLMVVAERVTPSGRRIPDGKIFGSLDQEGMLDMYVYTGWTFDEVCAKYVRRRSGGDGPVCRILGAEQTDKFEMWRLRGDAAQSLDGARAVAVVTSGAGVVCGQPVKAGDRFVVWGEPEISVQGDAEIVLCK